MLVECLFTWGAGIFGGDLFFGYSQVFLCVYTFMCKKEHVYVGAHILI